MLALLPNNYKLDFILQGLFLQMCNLTFSRRRFQTGKLWPCSRVGFISFFLSFMMRMLKLMQFRDEFVLLGPCPLQAFFYSSTLLWDP